MPSQDTVELRWVFAVVRRWWWLIVGCGLLIAGTAFVFSYLTAPVYSASTTLLVDVAPGTGMADYNAIRASQQMADTYSEMLTGRPVLEASLAKLGLTESPNAVAQGIKVKPIPDTQLLELSVESTDPALAALLANAIAEAFVDQMEILQAGQQAELRSSVEEQIDELSTRIDQTQAEIDTLVESRIQAETGLTRQERLLTEYRSDYRLLQQDYEQAQLDIAQSADSVQLVKEAQVQKGEAGSPYTATVTLLVSQLPATGTADYSSILASERLAMTYAPLVTARNMLEDVIAQLGLRETPDSLVEKVKAETLPESQLILISITDNDAEQAALVANAIAETFISYVQELRQGRFAESLTDMENRIGELTVLIEETQADVDRLTAQRIRAETERERQESLLAEYRGEYQVLHQDLSELRLAATQSARSVSILEPAQTPSSPVRPRTMMNTMLGALVGVMVGTGVAFLLEYLDDKIWTPEDVSKMLGIGTLAAVGRLADGQDSVVVATQPRSAVTEAFRVLVSNIRFSSVDKPLRALMVTSPRSAEGKSLIVANLAAMTAQSGLGVVAVDADLRRPRLHRLFGLDARNGLSESIVEGTADGRLRSTDMKGLSTLTCGGLPPDPAQLLGSPRMKELLQELAEQADMVVVDSAPILPVADSAVLAPSVDGVLLVLRAGKSRREEAQQAVERLHQTGANLVGVVLNAVPTPDDVYYFRYDTPEEEEGSGPRRLQLGRLVALGTSLRQSVQAVSHWFRRERKDSHA